MSTILVIAREGSIAVYEGHDGKFNPNPFSWAKVRDNLSDDSIIQIVTALTSASQNGHKPVVTETKKPKKATPAKKAPAKKQRQTIPTEERLIKALAGFDDWRTIKDAHDLVAKYDGLATFQTDVKIAHLEAYLDRRVETPGEMKARKGRGRGAYMYRLNESGAKKLQKKHESALDIERQRSGMELT